MLFFYDNRDNNDNGKNGRKLRDVTSDDMSRYCLPDSFPVTHNPGTMSRVTTASLSTAFQAEL